MALGFFSKTVNYFFHLVSKQNGIFIHFIFSEIHVHVGLNSVGIRLLFPRRNKGTNRFPSRTLLLKIPSVSTAVHPLSEKYSGDQTIKEVALEAESLGF